MAKMTISRLFETSRILATKTGQEISDFIQYMAELAEQTIRNLRNGLTLEDNVRCLVRTITLTHNTQQIVNADGKNPLHVLATRAFGTFIPNINWTIDTTGNLIVTPFFPTSPSGAFEVRLVIFYS